MKVKVLTVLSVLLILLGCQTPQTSGNGMEHIKKDFLIEDFDQFVSAFEQYHPKTFINMEEFNTLVNDIRDTISDAVEYDFFQLIAPVIAKVNCGHTFMYYSDSQYEKMFNQKCYLPLDIKVIDEKLVVVDTLGNSQIEKWSTIHSINGLASADILNRLYDSLPSDGKNKTSKIAALNNEFGSFESFANSYYYYIEASDSFEIEFSSYNRNVSDSNEIQTASLSAGTANINFYGSMEELSHEISSNYGNLRIQNFQTYDPAELQKFKTSIDSFFAELNSRSIDNLIVDIRGNWGGDPYSSSYLLSYLLLDPFVYFAPESPFYDDLKKQTPIKNNGFKGTLYVIIDGGVFSTSGHFLSHIVDKNRAVIVGSESGASYICNDGPQEIKLTHSGITVSIPQYQFATSVTSLEPGTGIQPDIRVHYSIDDYKNKTDLEMQTILSMINS